MDKSHPEYYGAFTGRAQVNLKEIKEQLSRLLTKPHNPETLRILQYCISLADRSLEENVPDGN